MVELLKAPLSFYLLSSLPQEQFEVLIVNRVNLEVASDCGLVRKNALNRLFLLHGEDGGVGYDFVIAKVEI